MAAYRLCEISGCGNRHEAKGLCQNHYVRARRQAGGGERQRRAPRPLCSVPGCLKEHRARGVCFTHYKQWEYHGFSIDRRPAIRSIVKFQDRNGYVFWTEAGHPQADGANRVLEHRAVMAEVIGRPLVKGENVHHINGNRADNRPQNLELWVTTQPSGQRPADLVTWAREIIARYGDSPA